MYDIISVKEESRANKNNLEDFLSSLIYHRFIISVIIIAIFKLYGQCSLNIYGGAQSQHLHEFDPRHRYKCEMT